MSEITDLVVIEKSTALDVFKSSDSVEDIISKVEREVESFVADVNTTKGRKDIASMAYKVAQSKTYLDGLGKDLVAELKEVPKLIDANRKTVRDRLDALRDKVRQPLTEWEAEQERIKAEEEAKRAAEELAKQVEADHEIALLMNEKFDRDLAEAKAEAERQRIAHEEALKLQAAEQAKREAARAAQREIDAAAAREREALLAKERAERESKEAAERAESNRIAAEQRAEREKQEAIEKVQRESAAKEEARLAEEKRIADEQAKREADVKHRKAVGTDIVNALTQKTGISREEAIRVLTALKDDLIPHTRITY
ncbi:hypothetical protein F6Q07_22925 [Pectobacterium parmentieri]|uniref:hypothetical protein n=1 Tax=Pectobacterium parmentieri TaxID=1905730 RepID=UPI000EAC5497|nr:hypothetical protein [Pectobacterium parmentieri]AYH33265.1 hypothetical protein C5E19_17455 [Pectobacterium parmentieri]MBI0520908.1 hypothetical protein [Pectobacterium parmentieri]RKO74388.1 hypothetical protein C5E04_18905 [Pectobacterium parmentieri]